MEHLPSELVEVLKAAGAFFGSAAGAAFVGALMAWRGRKQLEPVKGRLRQGAETFAELREGQRLTREELQAFDERIRRLEDHGNGK